MDFVAVIIGYAVSTEPTLLAFYERAAFCLCFYGPLWPQEPASSPYRESLPCSFGSANGGGVAFAVSRRFGPANDADLSSWCLWDRQGHHLLVVDVDGTKQAAQQRALLSLANLPAPHRRFDQVCAPGYLGRKCRLTHKFAETGQYAPEDMGQNLVSVNESAGLKPCVSPRNFVLFLRGHLFG